MAKDSYVIREPGELLLRLRPCFPWLVEFHPIRALRFLWRCYV